MGGGVDYKFQVGGSSLNITVLKFLRKGTEWRLLNLALQNLWGKIDYVILEKPLSEKSVFGVLRFAYDASDN